MADCYDEINLLVNDIIEGKVSKEIVASRIDMLKKSYGDDIFPSINFQKEQKPWNNAYFSKLKMMNITGAGSEEFLLHMAEVSEEITARKKRKIIAIVVVAIIVLFMIFMLFLGNPF